MIKNLIKNICKGWHSISIFTFPAKMAHHTNVYNVVIIYYIIYVIIITFHNIFCHIKTCLRFTMGNMRSIRLTSIYIHRDQLVE